MNDLRLTIAIGDYDHVNDLTAGHVKPEGIELLPLDMPIEEIFWRMLKYEEFDVTELSFGMYTSLISRPDPRFLAIPVFVSKVFRHAAIFVRRGGSITTPEQLNGARVGVPQWSQTACTFARGMLVDRYGLRLEDVHWLQAGVNEPGREEPSVLKLPPGIELAGVPDRSLNEMMLAGDLDAVISARPPNGSLGADAPIVRMFPNYVELEQAYFRDTGIFPIMHLIVMRRAAYEANRWIARSLYKAFEKARQRSLERLRDGTASRIAVPWLPGYLSDMAAVMGPDPFAYGIEPNRKTLEAFARYTFEQGVAHRQVAVEELFAPEMLSEYRV